MKLKLLFILVLAWMWLPVACLAADVPELKTQLNELVTAALNNNPDLQAARDRWEMVGHKVIPAQTLDDPRLSVALSNYPVDNFKADQTPMTGNEVTLSQNFPFPGKLAAKGESARQQALWYKAVYEDTRLQLAQQVKDAYFRLFYQDRAIAVTNDNLTVLKSFISLTKTRYEVGGGLQQDLLKAQVEQSKLLDRLFTLRQQRVSVLAGLNRLLSRPAASPLLTVDKVPLTPVAFDARQLVDKATDGRPMYAAYQALISDYESQRKLAKLDYYPDFNVWTSYRFRDDNLPDGGTDFLSAGVGINLPIWREKRDEGVARADSGIRMAQQQFADFRNQVDATIQDAYAQLEKNRDLAQLFTTGIIPQAQQSFDASLTAYQVGKVEFLTLLDSLMTLYRYQLDYQRALADYQRNLAQLEAASGFDPTSPGTTPAQSTDRMKQ